MALISIQDLSFTYPASLQPVFQHVNLELDTAWRLGLVGRNGRGKTTFLKLLLGQLKGSGSILAPEAFEYFPLQPENLSEKALAVARATIAPFSEWEAQMAALAAQGTEEAMEEYGDIEQAYAAADGYIINETITAEAGRLGIHSSALERPFSTLSGGEQVKLLLAALFLKKHRFLLIDEPTDHLDAEGRKTVAKWLAGKGGFILVSHDRAFVDQAVDHILSINRADIELQRGNYSSWRHNRTLQDEHEMAENRRLETDIGRLKVAAARTERWSDKIEKSKTGNTDPNKTGPASVDRGYIGHQAARMMQRSKSIRRRQNRQIEEKQSLLKNVESAEPLKFLTLPAAKSRLITAEGLGLQLGGRTLFEGLSFSINSGDRISVSGPNGSGKTSLLRLVLGQLAPTFGALRRLSGLVVSTLPQTTEFLQGDLRAFAAQQDVEESLMLAILRKLDFEREAFARPMQGYSAGQKKKVCLAASLAKPAQLFVWDEPLNYIDVLSREQIEAAALQSKATLLFVEHDTAFSQAISSKEIHLA